MSSYDLCVIGSSWGGLEAIDAILKPLPASLPFAVVIVQHRSADAPDSGLPSHYDARVALPVGSVEDKDAIEPGRVYIAPPDYHLLVDKDGFALSVDAPVQYSRPSIDVLFDSAAEVYGSRTIGILLTGAGEDGVEGLKKIRKAGGLTIVQDPDTAARPAMPAAAIAAEAACEVLDLEKIGIRLSGLGGA